MYTGVNTEKVGALCLEIQDHADKIKNVLSQIEDIVDNLEPNLQGDGARDFKNKFETLKEHFPTIYDNITSYIDEFNVLSSKYVNNDEELSSKLKISAERYNDGRRV